MAEGVLTHIRDEEREMFNKVLPNCEIKRTYGYMSNSYSYGNISIRFKGAFTRNRLVCMKGQCSTCILYDLTNKALENLDKIETLARFYNFSKIIITDNKKHQILTDKGYNLFDTIENKRTLSTIYFYSKCF